LRTKEFTMMRLVLATGGVIACLAGAAVAVAHHQAGAALVSDAATASTTLTANTSLTSTNGDYRLLMTADGDLVEDSVYGISPILIGVDDGGYLGGGNATAEENETVTGAYVGSTVTQIWDSGTGGNPGARAVLQGDGNFVIYSASNVVLWSSGTAGNPGATLAVQNDGNVVLYDGGQALWASRTVSIVDGHGSNTVNFRSCPDVTFPGCGITQTLPDGTGITMLCWESVPPVGWVTPPPSNKWFYVLVDGTQNNLGFINAGYVDDQIATPPCIQPVGVGQTPPSPPTSLPVSTPAGGGSSGTGSAGTFTETVGGPTATWTNYSDAGGSRGATIPSGQSVQVTCVVQGFEVADGNTNWYLIASSPWDNAYYASADAFYNNGATSGSLDGTPDVDPSVPAC
jgi:hypothetical protein